MKQVLKSGIFFFILLAAIAVGAVGLVIYSTPEGLGLSDDSIAYIAGARSILAGHGYREAWLASNGPVTHFPPAFSFILAFIGLSGMDPLRGARFLNAILFGANSFLLGLLGWRMTRSQMAGISLALLFSVNASLFNAHVVAMSEPLYIFFTLASFMAFSFYFLRAQAPSPQSPFSPHPQAWLVATGVLTALAYLTRYAGLALLATFLVALVIFQDSWRKRFLSAVMFGIGFVPFFLAWLVRNKIIAENATNRRLVFHPLTVENLQIGIYNISEFLIPYEPLRRALMQIPAFFAIITFFLALILLVWLANKGIKKIIQPSTPLPEPISFTSGLYIYAYLASITASMLLFDASTKFKLRILAPVYVALLVLLIFVLHQAWQRAHRALRSGLVLIFVLLLTFSAHDTSTFVARLHGGGQGYASFKWYDSLAMKYLAQLPAHTRIYTNQPGPVYLYTDHPAYVLPDLVDPVTGQPRPAYTSGVQVLQQDILSGQAVLALFKSGSEDEDVQSIYSDLALGLYLAHNSRGDKIYTAFP